MKILEPSFKIITKDDHILLDLKNIEDTARLSHMSKRAATEEKGEYKLIKSLIRRGHMSPFEFGCVGVRITCDRGVANELERHRLASFCQESTRYCNYSKDKFDNQISVVRPVEFLDGTDEYELWKADCERAEATYFNLVSAPRNIKPENARSVLPLSLATKLAMAANYREWRHIFELRTSKQAHPDMRALMIPMLKAFKAKVPVIFDDIEPNK